MTNGRVWRVVDSSTGAVSLTRSQGQDRARLDRRPITCEIEGANVYPRVKQVLTESKSAAEKAAASNRQAAQARDCRRHRKQHRRTVQGLVAQRTGSRSPTDEVLADRRRQHRRGQPHRPKVTIRHAAFFGGYRRRDRGRVQVADQSSACNRAGLRHQRRHLPRAGRRWRQHRHNRRMQVFRGVHHPGIATACALTIRQLRRRPPRPPGDARAAALGGAAPRPADLRDLRAASARLLRQRAGKPELAPPRIATLRD